MPKFIGLTDAIQNNIAEALNNLPAPSPGSPLATSFNSFTTVNEPIDNTETGVLRWGFSVWGVNPVTKYYKPNVIK